MRNSKTHFGLAAVALCGLLLPNPAAAQLCADNSTTIYWVNHLWRTASNNVDALAGTQIVGDYWYTWAATISSTEQVSSTTIHTGSASVGYGGNNTIVAGGTAAGLQWDDPPSTRGAGAYSLSNYHQAYSECGGGVLTQVTYDSLSVNQPTIGGTPITTQTPYALYNLGSGTADPIYTSNGSENYSYNQSVVLTAQTNCGVSDTCNDTPQWTISSPASTLNLSTSSGSQTTLRVGPSMGNCQYDTPVSFSIGGFSSSTLTFAVNSPTALNRTLSFTSAIPFGYQTGIQYELLDACFPHNVFWTMPMSEQFGLSWSYGSGVAGWNPPTPDPWASFNVNYYTFQDNIFASCSACIPTAVYTESAAPYLYNTPLQSGQHNFNAGSTTSGVGASVYSGTIIYYQDHGDNQP